MTRGVAIVGAGLIGRKRAASLASLPGCTLVATADVRPEAARDLARDFGGAWTTDWRRAVSREDVDIVVVATYNNSLAPVSVRALKNGKHVLCEKPLGLNAAQSRRMCDEARRGGRVLKTGFNHRHHPALAKAKQLLRDGVPGRLMYLKCRYGHGGRPGYEDEWRARRSLCGGGELLDQGVHAVDLFRWCAGEFTEAYGRTATCFWPMEVEDNAFALFSREDGVMASMHTSWTQWKNLFRFEIFGDEGYLAIQGLGGSYGTETLTIGRRRPEGGPPEETVMEFPGPDVSWREEWQAFVSAIENGTEPMGNGWDGYRANRMIEAVYRSARTGRTVRIGG